jgi:16S rRNA (guanine1207-N2)-methyltransferase
VDLVLESPALGALRYVSKPGVFSYRATDPGTALLARFLGPMRGARVLDLCCGCGVLALAASRLGAREVVATDSSAAAVAAARRNLAGAAVPARVLCAHLADGAEGEFDVVLSNPPFHRDAETDYSFPGRVLDAVLPRLSPGGRMLLVANQFLDYPGEARGRFASCEILARESGYRVLRLAP